MSKEVLKDLLAAMFDLYTVPLMVSLVVFVMHTIGAKYLGLTHSYHPKVPH